MDKIEMVLPINKRNELYINSVENFKTIIKLDRTIRKEISDEINSMTTRLSELFVSISADDIKRLEKMKLTNNSNNFYNEEFMKKRINEVLNSVTNYFNDNEIDVLLSNPDKYPEIMSLLSTTDKNMINMNFMRGMLVKNDNNSANIFKSRTMVISKTSFKQTNNAIKFAVFDLELYKHNKNCNNRTRWAFSTKNDSFYFINSKINSYVLDILNEYGDRLNIFSQIEDDEDE